VHIPDPAPYVCGTTTNGAFTAEGIAVKKVGPRAPNMNAFAERWVQSVRRECLDQFIILGETHLRYLLKEYETHHNLERPHQGVGNVPLSPQQETPTEGAIECHERLGGLLRHYYRKSA
jgi:putative transposase